MTVNAIALEAMKAKFCAGWGSRKYAAMPATDAVTYARNAVPVMTAAD